MRVDVSKFGQSLLSRPAGHEAALALQANVLRDIGAGETIELDFGKVLVLTPSWGDEFIALLRQSYGERIKIVPSDNSSVQLTLKTIGEKVAV